MKELSEIDAIIIKELLEDGRKSFSAIGQDNNTSKDVIWKHYKELKKNGVIVGATTQQDVRKLGFSGLATISISLETQHIAETFERLKKMPELGLFRYYNTSNNLTVIAALKNFSDLQRVKEIISKQNKINEIHTNLWLEVRNIPENIFSVKNEPKREHPKKKRPLTEIKNVKVDSVDLQIIDKLTKNGRLPFSKIAQAMGLSTNTIVRRYEKLTLRNIIKVSIQFNTEALGYQAILELNLALSNQSETNEITEKLSKIPGISYIVKLGGNYDLIVLGLVKDCKGIIAINDEIVKIPNIKKIDATLRQIPPAWPTPAQYISTF